MSLLKSWINTASRPSWIPPTSPSNTQGSSSAAAASTIQLPPSASQTLALTRTLNRQDDSTERYLALKRREKAFQHDLQRLLDAQASALAGGGLQDDATSEGASESTGRSASSKVVPVRQPEERPMTLRAARRAITRSMRELSSIKSEQQDYLTARERDGKAVRERAEAWAKRRADLNTQVDNIQHSQRGDRADELKQESTALEEQINSMELQLMELKSKHRAVISQLNRLDNSVQAKVSSYRAALSQLDSEIQQFLARPPLQPLEQPSEDSYLNLPRTRRTLGMALEYLQSEESNVQEQLKTTEEEQEALEDGIVMWRDVTKDISKFETLLHSELRRLKPVGDDDTTDKGHSQSMNTLQKRLDETIQQVEGKLRTAESNGWNLLVCCIGAELEALHQGREIIREASSASQGSTIQSASVESSKSDESKASGTSTAKPVGDTNRRSSQDSRQSKESGESHPDHLLVEHESYDDDGPDH